MIAGCLTVNCLQAAITSRLRSRYHRRYQASDAEVLPWTPTPRALPASGQLRSCRCRMACLPHRTRPVFGCVDDGLEQLGDCKRFDIRCATSSVRTIRIRAVPPPIRKAVRRGRCFLHADGHGDDFHPPALLSRNEWACSTAIFIKTGSFDILDIGEINHRLPSAFTRTFTLYDSRACRPPTPSFARSFLVQRCAQSRTQRNLLVWQSPDQLAGRSNRAKSTAPRALDVAFLALHGFQNGFTLREEPNRPQEHFTLSAGFDPRNPKHVCLAVVVHHATSHEEPVAETVGGR